MPTLHIEHSISDYATWKSAFDQFADARTRAGVLRHHLQSAIDDPNYLVIGLDFTTTSEAQAFLGFLQENVWSSSQNAPALIGTPRTRILEQASTSDPNTLPRTPW